MKNRAACEGVREAPVTDPGSHTALARSGFRGLKGLGFRVWGLGFGVWGLRFRGLLLRNVGNVP